MNKTAIKNFAVRARAQLLESVKQKAYEYDIKEDGFAPPDVQSVGGRLLTTNQMKQRHQLIEQIRAKSYSLVMEEAAYVWFNRFIALRYMEVNGFLPSKVRIFTDESGAFKPEIMKEALTVHIDGLDRDKILSMLDKQDNEELYKYLLIAQCNALSESLPYMFERIANWTELLFPSNLLRPDSVIGQMIQMIPEEDWLDEVEIIGWLYQYYISEKHEEIIDPLHGKVIKKEDIPAATQLFTTDWVVRYILDNSLGRYWLQRHPESPLRTKLTFLAVPKDGRIETVNDPIRPEELKLFDPCVGSGHFLSYAFDILMEIYRECGWSDRDAAASILENNLYGLDIDDRAGQLACFTVTMKARKYCRRILNNEIKLHVATFCESDFLTDDFMEYFADANERLLDDLRELKTVFCNAKEYGSILFPPQVDIAALYERIDSIQNSFADDLLKIQYKGITEDQLLPLIRVAEILSLKYDVVATNPPYLNKYSPLLKEYIGRHFANYKGDLFSVFVFHSFSYCKEDGYVGFMTPMVWMFIKTYEALREYILSFKSITTLIQFEYSAFEEATVPICSFVLKNKKAASPSLCFRLSSFTGGMEIQKQKVLEALENKECAYYYEADQSNFSGIPGSPIAYWLGKGMLDAFSKGTLISEIGEPKQGMATTDNKRFLRRWYEVAFDAIKFDAQSTEDALSSQMKWFPYNKGGEYRKWYGNNDYVVNYSNDGYEIKQSVLKKYSYLSTPDFVVKNAGFYFKKSITWSYISSTNFGVRASKSGFIFDVSGSSLFVNDELYFHILALLCSKISTDFINVINPTMNIQAGSVGNIPVIFDESGTFSERIEELAKDNIALSKQDWDAFEISWDFKKHPLI